MSDSSIRIDRIHEFARLHDITALLDEDYRVHVVCRRETVADRAGRPRDCTTYVLELDDEAGGALARLGTIPRAAESAPTTPLDEGRINALEGWLIDRVAQAEAVERALVGLDLDTTPVRAAAVYRVVLEQLRRARDPEVAPRRLARAQAAPRAA